MSVDPITEAFRPILGLPCWLVTRVHGSIVSRQFGQPRLTVNEPRVRPVFIEGIPDLLQRHVRVEGAWSMTIYLCRWSLHVDDVRLTASECDQTTMERALAVLNGQRVTNVQVAVDGVTEFTFDMGAVLRCWPAEAGTYPPEPSEMWWVSSDTWAAAVRDDLTYSAFPTTAARDDIEWLPLSSRSS